MTEFIQISGSHPDPIFGAIAQIHAEELKAGLLPLLGEPFLRQLYRYAAADPKSVLIAVQRDGQCVGFVMGSVDPTRFYRGARLRTWPLVAWALVRHPQLLGRIRSLGRYVSRRPDEPLAELLSIAVAVGEQRSGVGQGLYDAFCLELARRGIDRFYVTASDTQQPALRFYRRQACEVVSERDLGGLRSFTFVCKARANGAL